MSKCSHYTEKNAVQAHLSILSYFRVLQALQDRDV